MEPSRPLSSAPRAYPQYIRQLNKCTPRYANGNLRLHSSRLLAGELLVVDRRTATPVAASRGIARIRIRRPAESPGCVSERHYSLLYCGGTQTLTPSPFLCTASTCCLTNLMIRSTIGSKIFFTSSLGIACQNGTKREREKVKEKRSASILSHSVKAVLNILCWVIRYSGNIYFAAFQVCDIPKLEFDFLLPGPEHFVLAAGLVAVLD